MAHPGERPRRDDVVRLSYVRSAPRSARREAAFAAGDSSELFHKR